MRMDPKYEKANEIYFRLGIIYKGQQKYTQSLEVSTNGVLLIDTCQGMNKRTCSIRRLINFVAMLTFTIVLPVHPAYTASPSHRSRYLVPDRSCP
jgi:hypothetical protein